MPRRQYSSDLTDAQWELLEPLIPKAKLGGRPPKHSRREITSAILYVLRTGRSWRLLPHDFPPYQSVYHYFRIWRIDGLFEKMTQSLRQKLRVKAGREPSPSAAILDSQSVKTTEKGGSRADMSAGATMEPSA